MKKFIPSVNGSKAPNPVSTAKHLDALFSSLQCIIGLKGPVFGPAFVSALSIAYQRVQGLLFSSPEAAIKELKASRKAYLEYIRGGPLPSNWTIADNLDASKGVVYTKRASILESICTLRETIKATAGENLIFFDQVVYCFLSMDRLIVTPISYDFATITNAKKEYGDKEPGVPIVEIDVLLARLGITGKAFQESLSRHCESQTHMILSTSGPNGPASWTAYTDAVAILRDMKFFKQIKSFAEEQKLGRFLKDMVRCVSLPNVDGPIHSGIKLGKIYSFAELGGKTRHVAILDYWSQLLLTPLHNTLFDILRVLRVTTDEGPGGSKITELVDGTFNQDEACESIRKMTLVEDNEVYSVDLTAATDRLPIELQKQVLIRLTNNEILASAWVQVLVGRKYATDSSGEIEYATGGPMGAKSNWAMLALTHHLLVQLAAKRAGKKAYNQYRIVGDDLVLTGKDVYLEYLKIMEHYGVTVNLQKSVLHGPMLRRAAEFCKRVYIEGVEYTAIPERLLVKTSMNGRLVFQLQSELFRRGFKLPGDSILSLFAALVDRESLELVTIANVLPTEITGLRARVPVSAQNLKLENWFKDVYKLQENDIVQAFTYVAVVEQLQRLDALLRQTAVIADAIRQAVGGYRAVDLSALGWTEDDTKSGLHTTLVKHQGEMSMSHPIVLATYTEVARITQMLAELTTGDSSLSSAARFRLLDSFRNALVGTWADEAAARGQADRSLMQRSLDSLDKLVAKKELLPTAGSVNEIALSFTVSLAYLKRLWVVRWALGSNVTINATQSSVTSSSEVAANTYSNVAKLISIQGRSRRTGVKPLAATPVVESPS